MKKSILEVYALTVCFVTLMCFVIALGIGIHDLAQVASPAFMLPSREYLRYQTNEAFRRSLPEAERNISDEEASRRRREDYQQALWLERRNAIRSLVLVTIVLAIDMVVFAVHWLMAKRARASVAPT